MMTSPLISRKPLIRWTGIFLYETLSAFGFGSSFIQWVRTFYQNISSCVINNGFATGHFSIQRGVRQGDPLSPYLYIIVLEVLAIRICGDANIRGVNADGNEIKLEIFAADLTGFAKNENHLINFLIQWKNLVNVQVSALIIKQNYSFLGIKLQHL